MELNKNYIYKDECYEIIGCCMYVHSELGPGFLEAIYQEALEIEFDRESLPFKREVEIDVSYRGQKLKKKYIADFICYGEIIIELKAVKTLEDSHYAQLLNYLKATDMKIGLLINFGSKSLQYKRVIL
ncbi:GxxExxY protein [Ancylomarina salipaludis]|uniref:GxxExxY protein n=1 Tax=Ancylomarina salipaludis TaxID=2501299 RepID=A0A4Q1JKC3_9BACT|nr:GxxExxY protein [Ancylomarina salipaludis]RXQ93015.1 GxxExxY protein [Ancylomarina salipaludis]